MHPNQRRIYLYSFLAGLVYAYWLHSGDRRGMRKKY